MINPHGAMRKLIRLAAVAMVLILAAGAGYEIRNTRLTYSESALIVFSLPKSQSAPYAYTMFAPSLIASGSAITQIVMSPQVQRQIRMSGGTADVSMALVNLYSEQYPDYGQPLATLTATSPIAANVHQSFRIAARLLARLLAAQQAHARVPPRKRISAQIIGDTGPVAEQGSAKRVYGGLTVLALVAVCVVWGFLRQRDTSKNRPAAVYN
jgi:hypothetical protein